jgi:hypothetical protein
MQLIEQQGTRLASGWVNYINQVARPSNRFEVPAQGSGAELLREATADPKGR